VCGISFDSVAENAAFASKFNYPFDLLCDTQRAVGLAYGACDAADEQYARRITYLIDKQGVIARAYAKVKPAEHPAEVLRDLAGLA
jgi:peroxiredoxin Q/BCP